MSGWLPTAIQSRMSPNNVVPGTHDRFLNLLTPKVGLIHDVDDTRKSGAGAYYTKSNPLTLDARAKK